MLEEDTVNTVPTSIDEAPGEYHLCYLGDEMEPATAPMSSIGTVDVPFAAGLALLFAWV